MDKLLYIAMTGAKETLRAQAANNHNLANASTTGFRADLSAFQSRAVAGAGYASRVYATDSTTGWDDTTGPMQTTGNSTDIAIQGPGFIAVQGPDGKEAYTRAGDLHVDPNGMLLNGTGHQVMGDGGPISVPPHNSIDIAADGTVSVVPLGQNPNTIAAVGRIKLVNPPTDQVMRGEDGLFRLKSGDPAPADANVKVASGVIESSNVNIANSMVTMIQLARNFDLQVKAIKSAEDNGASSTKILQSS
ncbi:MAG TPA: flagellar basal-body rod protein FlgF [Steroidobacteraceae bacterium]